MISFVRWNYVQEDSLLSVIVLSVSILLISAQSGGNAANLYDESARLMSTFVNKPYSVQFNASAEFDSMSYIY